MTIDMVGLIALAAFLAASAMSNIARGTFDFTQALSDHIAAVETGDFSSTGEGHGAPGGSGQDANGARGNPGNNAAVGGAGENPNGSGGWGSGAKGKSS